MPSGHIPDDGLHRTQKTIGIGKYCATDRYLSVVTAGRISGAVQRRPELNGWVQALISTGAAPTSN